MTCPFILVAFPTLNFSSCWFCFSSTGLPVTDVLEVAVTVIFVEKQHLTHSGVSIGKWLQSHFEQSMTDCCLNAARRSKVNKGRCLENIKLITRRPAHL